MKNFTDHIKSLNNEKIDYFITDSELNIIHEEIENAAILSGSFNPVHSGHINLLDYCFNKLNLLIQA